MIILKHKRITRLSLNVCENNFKILYNIQKSTRLDLLVQFLIRKAINDPSEQITNEQKNFLQYF